MSGHNEGDDLSSVLSSAIGRRVAAIRTEMGWSAQRLADRMAELGHPMKRSTIANLETGHRGVSVADLAVIARALHVAPIVLLADLDSEEPVALIPGEAPVHPWIGIRWWTGQALPTSRRGSQDAAFGQYEAFIWANDMSMQALARWEEYERALVDYRQAEGEWGLRFDHAARMRWRGNRSPEVLDLALEYERAARSRMERAAARLRTDYAAELRQMIEAGLLEEMPGDRVPEVQDRIEDFYGSMQRPDGARSDGDG